LNRASASPQDRARVVGINGADLAARTKQADTGKDHTGHRINRQGKNSGNTKIRITRGNRSISSQRLIFQLPFLLHLPVCEFHYSSNGGYIVRSNWQFSPARSNRVGDF
jgi:hypothetical protein